MRKLLLHFLVFLILVAGMYSCTPNPNGGIPIYMRMDSVTLTTNYAIQGLNTQNITDVWVQANTDDLGAYQLPANFPVLQENNVRFVVSAGIEVGGLVAYRDKYPFYLEDTFAIVATRGVNYHHKPSFRYRTATVFAFTPIDFEYSNGFDSMKICSDTDVMYGHRCGQITVTATGDSNVVVSQLPPYYSLPAGQEVWLEVDYKCDVPFNIGFFANSNGVGFPQQYPEMFVLAKPTWSKLYVKFSNEVAMVAAQSYYLYFEALRPQGSNGGSVYLDNIKLVHF